MALLHCPVSLQNQQMHSYLQLKPGRQNQTRLAGWLFLMVEDDQKVHFNEIRPIPPKEYHGMADACLYC
ncbi:hypothetical protein BYT27DRAFT_7283683 [Phlegmacium glaucopus]|nr:hypothetical protein BYT27DRAFT_7283683 [Phlegmacium glaucopus]